jgi:hypothetical protein
VNLPNYGGATFDGGPASKGECHRVRVCHRMLVTEVELTPRAHYAPARGSLEGMQREVK